MEMNGKLSRSFNESWMKDSPTGQVGEDVEGKIPQGYIRAKKNDKWKAEYANRRRAGSQGRYGPNEVSLKVEQWTAD